MNAAVELREAADDYLFGLGLRHGAPVRLIRQVSAIAPKFGGLYFDDQGVANGLNYASFIAPLVMAYQETRGARAALEAKRAS